VTDPLARSPFRLVAVDLDGTLLDHQGVPHARDVRALQAAARAGVTVSIVTGRLYSGTRAAAEAVGIVGPIACAEGSHLVHGGDHSTIQHHGLAAPASRALRVALQQRGSQATFLFAQDSIIHDAHGAPHLEYVRTWSPTARPTAAVLEHPTWDEPAALTGVVSVGTQEQIALLHEDLRRQGGAEVQVATFALRRPVGAWGMFVRAAGINKGSALAFVARHHGHRLEETIAIGDWLNDVAMFKVAGRSYAMGQAPDEVKQAASDVLRETSREGGGIARVIEENFGIRVD
jgi:Cof subfamily protein (haloacid dehalogenase superfamily)